MSRMYDAYQVYREKGERMEPTEFLRQYTNDAEIKALTTGAVKINSQTKGMCGTGVYEGTFRALDGRVFERKLTEFSYTIQLRVWASEESYNNHREVLPFNMWAWG